MIYGVLAIWTGVDTHKKFPHILIEKRTICTFVQI